MLVLQDQERLPVWVNSVHMHTNRLMNSRLKRSKKNDDKSAVAMLKRQIGKKEDLLLLTNITIAQGNLIRVVVKSWDEIHRNVSYLMHDNWVAYFRT